MTPGQQLRFCQERVSVADAFISAIQSTKGTILQKLVEHAKVDAANALSALVDAEEMEDVRACQQEIRRYFDLIDYIRCIVDAGVEASYVLDQASKDDLLRLATSDEGIEDVQEPNHRLDA